mmetsp:Transcript_29366/g.50307  ORF Transcript_29366/g.50307 Transcript_29366/m.50307 type:complete len:289 (-) Transcript_29366:212-1078(-)
MGCGAGKLVQVKPQVGPNVALPATDEERAALYPHSKLFAVRGLAPDNHWTRLLTPAQMVEVHNAFSRFDRNGDGSIEAKEMLVVMREMGVRNKDDEARALIASVDIDGNGRVEFDEFLAMMARRILTIDGEVELEQAFQLFDADNSGYVTADEVRSLMQSSGDPLSDAEVEEMIALADPDANGRITIDEFKAMSCWQIEVLPDVGAGVGRGSRSTASSSPSRSKAPSQAPSRNTTPAPASAKGQRKQEGETTLNRSVPWAPPTAPQEPSAGPESPQAAAPPESSAQET